MGEKATTPMSRLAFIMAADEAIFCLWAESAGCGTLFTRKKWSFGQGCKSNGRVDVTGRVKYAVMKQ